MKAFTSIEQSKKLAEILLIESADMWFANGLVVAKTSEEPKDIKGVFPCWSLAALLGVLPEVSLNTFKDGDWNAMVQHDSRMIYEDRDNPVDACYELILKLHEQKISDYGSTTL